MVACSTPSSTSILPALLSPGNFDAHQVVTPGSNLELNSKDWASNFAIAYKKFPADV